MALDTSIDLIEVEYNSTPFNIPEPTAKGLADGSLTSFSAPALGVTSLKEQRFNGFTSLQSLDLTGVTSIPRYTAGSCSALTNLTLDSHISAFSEYAFYQCSNVNMTPFTLIGDNTVIQQYAFNGVRGLQSIEGTFGSISGYVFQNCTGLTKIDAVFNGSIGQTAFGACYYINNLNLNNSNITTLSIYSFGSFGNRRSNPSSNILTFDFRNSTFTDVPQSCFQGESSYHQTYFNIYFPNTLTSISSTYSFRYSDYINIYYQSVPALSTTNHFNNTTNIKNFFPYNLVQKAKTSTNWSSSTNGIVDSIYGYAAENTFSLGDTLPDTDADGYALTWYSDIAMTQQVTTVSDPTQIYYCAVGSRIKVPLSITQYQATCTLSDGVNTYINGDLVPIGSTLTITAVGDTGYPDPYIFTLNGTTINSGDTYTATSTPIEITCIYYDGVNPPINPVFADNTWQQLAVAFSLGLHRTYWPITSGSTVSKQATLTDGTVVNMRLADSTANRYQFSDNSGYSQAVLEFNVCIPTQYRMNSTSTNAGGWPASEMSTQTMGIVYNMLPNDLKSLVKQVKVPSATSGSDSTLVYADNYCFLEAASEVYSSYSSYAYNEGAIYQYYSGTSNSAKIKQRSGTNNIWWLRSPYRNNSNYFCYVYTDGSLSNTNAIINRGVSVCLVI